MGSKRDKGCRGLTGHPPKGHGARMRVIVINTPDATERMDFQRDQFARLDLPFARLNAYTPDTVSDTFMGKSWRGFSGPMTNGERACLMSHYRAWESVREKGPALIVEDDALLADNVPELLFNVATLQDVDHVSLEVRGRRKLLGISRIPATHGVSLRRLYLDWHGAAAYILWPTGAEGLIKSARRGASTVDWLIGTAFDLRSFQTDPACALQLDMLGHYDLAGEVETVSRTQGERDGLPSPLQAARAMKGRIARVTRCLRYAGVARPVSVRVLPEHFSF